MRETGLGLPLAHLVVPGRAGRTGTAGADERHGDPVAGPPPSHPGAHRLDDPGEFVAGHVRQGDVGVVPLPAVPVAAAQPRGLDPHDDPVLRRLRIGDLPHLGRLAVPLEHHGPHGPPAFRSLSRPGRWSSSLPGSQTLTGVVATSCSDTP